MSTKLTRKPPYRDTNISVESSKAQIGKLLKDYGVEGTQWTTYKGEEDLKFIVSADIRGVHKEIMIQVKPPQIMVRRRIKGQGMVHTRNEKQEYRLLFWWLKSKIEAVVWGLSTIEKEFLSQVTVALPDGQTTIGDIMVEYIHRDQLTALPPPPEEDSDEPKKVDAEARIKEEEG